VVAVLDQPAADVGEVLGGVLQAVDVGDRVEGRAPGGADGEQVGEDLVQGHVVAVQRVRAERDVLDADQVGAVAEVVHDGLDRVPGVRRGQRRVRGGRHPDDAPGRGDGAQHVVGLHPRGIPDGPGAGVGDEHRLLAVRAGVQGGAVARVRQVDGQAQLVHPRHRPAAERGQAGVAALGQARAQRVGV